MRHLAGRLRLARNFFPREKGKKAHDDAVVALRHGYMLFRNVLKEDDINEE